MMYEPTKAGDYYHETGRYQTFVKYLLEHPDKKMTRPIRYMWSIYMDGFENKFENMLEEEMQHMASYLAEWAEEHEDEIPEICDDFLLWLGQVLDSDSDSDSSDTRSCSSDSSDSRSSNSECCSSSSESDECNVLKEGYRKFVEYGNPGMDVFMDIVTLNLCA